MNTTYSMKQAVLEAFKRIWEFEGRSTRSAYWMFQLATLLFAIVLGIIFGIATYLNLGFIATIAMIILGIAGIAEMVLNISLTCRRLADSGKNPLFILLYLIPLAGLIVFIFTCLDSEKGTNKWGPSLKYPN